MLIFLIVSTAQAKDLIKGQSGSKTAYVRDVGKTYELKSFDYDVSVPKSKCADKVMQRFLQRFELIYKKAIPLKKDPYISVIYQNKTKQFQPQSEIGKYFQNFSQIIITFKRESELPCK